LHDNNLGDVIIARDKWGRTDQHTDKQSQKR